MINCKKCNGKETEYRWAYFDKDGNLVSGMCIHGTSFKREGKHKVEDDFIDNKKVFVESGGIA